jgi:hypothetical protein
VQHHKRRPVAGREGVEGIRHSAFVVRKGPATQARDSTPQPAVA